MTYRKIVVGLAAMAILLVAPAIAHAQYLVNWNIGPLSGGGGYSLEFQLTDGEFVGDDNTGVTISNFTLGGGSLGAISPQNAGNISGDLSGTLALRDGPGATNAFADYQQDFSIVSPAAAISFRLDLSSAMPDVDFPDFFSLVLRDAQGNVLATDGSPTGAERVSVTFDMVAPVPQAFASAPGTVPFLAAPTIRAAPASGSVPEPGALCLLLPALVIESSILRSRHN